MAEEREVNREWEFAVNLSDVRAPTGGAREVPEGYYKGTITDCYTNADKPERVIFKLTISEPAEYAGIVRTEGMNMPRSAEDKVRYYWRGLAESAGYTAAQLDAGEVTLSPGAFMEKTVHFFYKPGNKAAKEMDKVSFLPPLAWNQQRQLKAAQSGSEAAPSRPAPVENGASGLPSKKDMLAKLGLSA